MDYVYSDARHRGVLVMTGGMVVQMIGEIEMDGLWESGEVFDMES